MKQKLTQAFVNTCTCPDGRKQVEYVDEGGTGLYLLVTRHNAKTFYLRYRSPDNGNKTTHVKLGRASDVTLSEAREKVKLLRADIAKGRDPQTETKQKRDELTYAEFMEDHYFPYIKPRRRNAGTYRGMYDREIKRAFGDRKPGAIRKRDVQAFHDELRGRGYSAAYANRHLQLIKSSWNVGLSVMELFDHKNPAVGIPLFEEEGKERYLNAEELSRLIPILLADEGTIAKIIRFLLATGLRLGECLKCEWKDIDLDNRVMTIPRAHAKAKKTDSIPLNRVAIEVLSECDRSKPHPFANPTTGKSYVSIKKGFQRLMQKACLEDVTAHVLRHTAASIMINAGRSLYDVQKFLRHSSSQVTERYAHLSQRTAQDASDTISEQLMKAAADVD